MFKYREEIEHHLIYDIIPFWKKLRDDEYGGYFGYVDYDLNIDETAVKGCILNNRITWFFSNAYQVTSDDSLLAEARHGYEFLRDKCLDHDNGGVFWSVNYDGTPSDTTKHTYNQAFAIYALSSYYDVSHDTEALNLAFELFDIIEEKCRDEEGYLEAFTYDFRPESNEKLSENGVMADRTMNTLLHVFEGYSELYRVSHNEKVGEKMRWILDVFASKIYNPERHRQEVFFDSEYNTLIDLISYGHDIESAWLIDRGVEILGDPEYEAKIFPVTRDLTANIYKTAFDGHSLPNECESGVVDEKRVWWVQAEGVLGFLNGYRKAPEHKEYLEAAESLWVFIKEHVIDPRCREWFMHVDPQGNPERGRPIVEEWKCPYHNGRMCMEVSRLGD
ncbi:MAG: AGE family epimerase/isomerase [Lachnospiraceae bacterium]|nr:AGE family epimerase/isomerase [Lachnospiraceae bacterium]